MSLVYSLWGRIPYVYSLACKPTFMFQEEKLRRRAVEKLGLRSGEAVLELCCGTGANFSYLREAVGNEGKVFGLDCSEKMLAAARKKRNREGWWNIYLEQGEAGRLDVEEEFEGVLCTLGLSAVSDYERAIENGVRALKKSGKMVVLDAKLFSEGWSVFNPLLRLVYGLGAEWKPERDIRGELEKRLVEVEYEEFNSGTMYIIGGRKG